MRVGIGLPTTLPGLTRTLLLEWARQADQGPFTSLGVLDRLLYGSLDSLVSLTAAAAVTEHVRLVTMIVIGPLRNTAVLAKQAASIDSLSNGRLTLGLAIGAREDDYQIAGVHYHTRGNVLNDQLGKLRSLWADDRFGPRPAQPNGPQILVGGSTDVVFSRVARYADGYVHGGGPPRAFAGAASRAHAAWSEAGRPGKPALWGQGYFALGAKAEKPGADYLRDYYAFTGPFAQKIADGMLTTPQAVLQFIRGYAEAGCDELILFPAVADLDQLKRLAGVIA
jgi:alkanesulfonate monooxygenase SsuD/methylene tetrahydromethanopterin reductase-like flavin-dependent oxidoreductase (luciferase family)